MSNELGVAFSIIKNIHLRASPYPLLEIKDATKILNLSRSCFPDFSTYFACNNLLASLINPFLVANNKLITLITDLPFFISQQFY
jgi:hypothetical protein